MKNFLHRRGSTLVQLLVECGFLQNPSTAIPVITPTPNTKVQDWCFPVHDLKVVPGNFSRSSLVSHELMDIDLDTKSGYLNFNFTPKTYESIFAEDFEEIRITLAHSLRSPEVHKSLGAQRKILTRFRRYDEGLLARSLKKNEGVSGKENFFERKETFSNEGRHLSVGSYPPVGSYPHLPLEKEERVLINASLWMRYQLETRDQPWIPSGLSQCLAPYTQALIRCWEHVRLDANGDNELFLERISRWRYHIKTIRAILSEILP